MPGWEEKRPGYWYNPEHYNIALIDGVWMVQKRKRRFNQVGYIPYNSERGYGRFKR